MLELCTALVLSGLKHSAIPRVLNPIKLLFVFQILHKTQYYYNLFDDSNNNDNKYDNDDDDENDEITHNIYYSAHSNRGFSVADYIKYLSYLLSSVTIYIYSFPHYFPNY